MSQPHPDVRADLCAICLCRFKDQDLSASRNPREHPRIAPLIAAAIALVSLLGAAPEMEPLSRWFVNVVDQKGATSFALLAIAALVSGLADGELSKIGFRTIAITILAHSLFGISYQNADAYSLGRGVPSFGTILAISACLLCEWRGWRPIIPVAVGGLGLAGYALTANGAPASFLYWDFDWSTHIAVPTCVALIALGWECFQAKP